MRLPNGKQAIIDRRKLIEYALNWDHDDGKHKAWLFWELLGLSVEDVDLLVEALLGAAADGNARTGRRDRYGQRYTVDFSFTGPKGTRKIRSVWIVRSKEAVPRLVTC